MCGVTGIVDVSGEHTNDDLMTKALTMGEGNGNRGKDARGMTIVFDDGSMENFKTRSFQDLAHQVASFRSSSSDKIAAILLQTRYITSGDDSIESGQPRIFTAGGKQYSWEFNGNISNHRELAQEHGFVETYGLEEPLLDTIILEYLMIEYIDANPEISLAQVIEYINSQLMGACNICIISSDKNIAISTDKNGVRALPYSFNEEKGLFVFSSEQEMIDGVSNRMKASQKLLTGGEIAGLNLSTEGVYSFFETMMQTNEQIRNIRCILEFVYFMRSDSQRCYEIRLELGKNMYEEHQEQFDPQKTVVMQVPNSAYYSALGYSRASGLEMINNILTKNESAPRTYMQQIGGRSEIISTSYDIDTSAIEALRDTYPDLESIVLIDDSVVNGGTMGYIPAWLKEEFKKVFRRDIQIHIRVPMHPVAAECNSGAVHNEDKLVIVQECDDRFHPTENELDRIAKNRFHADSLKYMSMDGLQSSIRKFREGIELCTACLDGFDEINGKRTLPDGTVIPLEEVSA